MVRFDVVSESQRRQKTQKGARKQGVLEVMVARKVWAEIACVDTKKARLGMGMERIHLDSKQ
jgi:hypothetical protein